MKIRAAFVPDGSTEIFRNFASVHTKKLPNLASKCTFFWLKYAKNTHWIALIEIAHHVTYIYGLCLYAMPGRWNLIAAAACLMPTARMG